MRKVACFLITGIACLGSAMLVTAAETWRWTDANGVIHYSDRPVPGAERVSVIAPKPSSSPPRQTGVDPAAAPASRATSEPAIIPYSRCAIIAPDAEETFNAVNSVTVSLVLQPELQAGHRIEVLVDGNLVSDWPQEALSHPVTNLFRGAHTVAARVLDAEGGTSCAGPAVTFYVRLPTVQAPRATPR
jgi:hypothetical protein